LITDWICSARARQPSAPAIIDGERCFTYEACAREIAKLAWALKGRVPAGARVGLLMGNCAELLFAQYAVVSLGAIAVPINVALHAQRVEEILRDAGVSVVLAQDRALRRYQAVLEACPDIALVVQDGREAALGKETALWDTLEERADFEPRRDVSEQATALILYTTGTTGRQKGVELTHANLMAATRNINEVMGLTEGEREVVSLPLTHSFGLGRTRCLLETRSTVIIESGLDRPDKVLSSCLRHQATGLASVPAGFAIFLSRYADLLNQCAGFLRYVEIGSAPMPLAHKRALMEALPRTRLFMHYGLTEASRSAFIEFHAEPDRLESVGKPAVNVSIKVADDQGRAVPPGQVGTIWIASDTVMKGYWNRPEDTARALVDSWLMTGDLGSLDEQGYLTLWGRTQDLINVGGYKVLAREVEDVLTGHPRVEESAVVGVRDPLEISGEVVKAFVVRKDDGVSAEELKRHCLKHLEPWKVPAIVSFVPRLPKTGSGKVQKQLLADALDAMARAA